VSTLRDILEEIRTKHGELNPHIVLEEAQNPAHPLHDVAAFKWDDDAAMAHQARLDVARHLIRQVRVSYVNKAGLPAESRFYRGLRTEHAGPHSYEPTADILGDSFKRKLLLSDMRRQIDELMATFEGVEEFWTYLRKAMRNKAS